MTSARVATVRAELRDDTHLVATPRPRLTWTVETDETGWEQASVDVRCTGGNAGDDEVTIDGRDSVLIDWPFTPLAVGQARAISVRVRATSGTQTEWSAPTWVEAAFLGDDEWVAQPIGLADAVRPGQPVLLRTAFHLDRPVERATLLWTALGSAEPEINGSPVSEDVLAPGWTSYRDRLIHETVDVTALVREGENVLAATLAGAWYTEKYGFFVYTDQVYGDQPSFLAQLRVEYSDGSVHTVAPTGDGWRAHGEGPIVDSGIYAGEHQDLRRAIGDWSIPGFDASEWPAARVGAVTRPGYENVPVPEARIAPPVRRIETRAVADVLTSPTGGLILDFGQNLVGRLRLRVTATAGQRVTVRHAEVLDEGELALRPLRNSASTATFDLADGEQTLESRFTFHGFRYAQIEGWPGDFDPADVEAVVLHTDMTRTGWFTSSDPMINRLHENVVWGMRGNFLSIPTDCPQRDERLGWTGDIQVFSPTAAYLYDSDAFLTSWLRDLAHEQSHNGGDVSLVVPAALASLGGGLGATAAWGDAATVVPSVLHHSYGDLGVLRDQYPSMKAWVDCVAAQAGESGLWAGRMQLGDWLDPSAPPDKPGQAKVDGDIVATAYFARSLRQVADAARLLGETDDVARYTALADRSRDAFVAEYVTPAGRMMSDAPTAYALALEFGLVTRPHLREALAQRLAEVVREGGYRIATGFVGTPLVTDALAKGGHLDAAARLLLQTENPSWLYPVTMGATTIWERWDSLLPDGSVNPGEMTSFNHYALGAVADWLHRTVAGLAPEEPGYRMLRIAPRPLTEFDHASASLRTPYGPASVAWRRDGTEIVVSAEVPPNTRAIVDLPGGVPHAVGSGNHEWRFTPEKPAARSIRFDLDSSLADVIDDPRAYRALLDTLAAHDPAKASSVRDETLWGTGRSVRTALMFTPPDLVAAVEDALATVPAATDRS
ncbi:alpha-L-rhamnosidase [Microbacterium rhizomatis]|uniref:alpha-L-rhamnosidase n=1 Tax=Microbacterium rhizomatis TaxID=1631477 RepID=A0A5J5IZ73_9MICO|nr:alpha-L-rhamnosidase [Microbacterium rhizomatis]KAA9107692.1 Bacterial alpha-L-rhamnosidase [Microbacterium rhizomatis]